MNKFNLGDIFKSTFAKQRLAVSAFILVLLSFMSVGYALYYVELNASSVVVLEAPLEIRIYDAIVGNSTSATDMGSSMTFQETSNGMKLLVDTRVHFDATGWGDSRANISYTYSVVNLSHKAYSFDTMTYSSEITNGTANIGDPVISGLTKGQVLKPGEELTFTASVTMGAILGISYEKDAIIHIELNFNEGEAETNIGNVETYLSSETLQLDDDNIANVNLGILNIYGFGIEYSLKTTNTDVLLVDKNGNEFNYTGTLNDGEVANHDVYLKVKDGVDLTNGVETSIDIVLSNNAIFTTKVMELTTDPNPKWKDAVVTYTISNDVLTKDEYEIVFTIKNNSSKTMDEYTAYLYLDSELEFESIENNDASIVYLPDEHLIKLSSNVKATSEHNSINPGGSFEYAKIKVKMNQTDLMIKESNIFKVGEIFTDNFNYTALDE